MEAAPVEFHVAADGNDTQPGTPAQPFATLEAAQRAARNALASENSGGAQDGVIVWLHQGTWSRSRTFELTDADSGHPGASMVYAAYESQKPRLIGGRVVAGFSPVQDPVILKRLPKDAREHVLWIDLSQQGVTDLGQLRSRGFARPSTPAHLELFFQGRPMTLARWPNEGDWERITGFPSESSQGDQHGGQLGALSAGFFYAGERPRSWQSPSDLWVHGYWAWDWANSYERVNSLDLDRHLIKTAAPYGLYGFRKNQRFYFLNVLEELDLPGEYFVDRAAGKLYFWPPGPMENAEVLVSELEEPLIRISNAHHIVLRGLELEATRGQAIRIQDGASNRIEGCTIRLTGNDGIEVVGGQGHVVLSCDVEDNGDGGISASGGDRATLRPAGHVVENCHFQRQGRWSKCYVPAILMEGVGIQAQHNLIHDHPHCAILFSGNDHRIEWNEIHHVALETGDVGAIYSGRDYTYRGNVIAHNFIHHTGGVGMGSMGVYMDDCVSGTEVVGNIFQEVTRAVFLGGGRDHRVENNLFIDCQPAVALDGRGLDVSPVWHDMVYETMKLRLSDVPGTLYRERYPAIRDLDAYYAADTGIPPEHNRITRNIAAGGKWLEINWHADATLQDIHDNYVTTDPAFVVLRAGSYRIQDDEAAMKIGFERIPIDQIGLYACPWRPALNPHIRTN